MSGFLPLLKKDLTIELRGKEVIISLFALSVLIAVFFGIGIENAFIEQKAAQRLFPTALWISFIFAASASVSRSLYYETELGALSSLICARVSLGTFFLAKVISNTIMNTAAFFLMNAALSAFFGIRVPLLEAVIIGGLVSLGYASVATLMASMTLRTKLRELLLSLVLFPLLFPLFFAGHELTMSVILEGSLPADSAWLALLFVMDAGYLLCGFLLFGAASRG